MMSHLNNKTREKIMTYKSFISKLLVAGIICSTVACSDDENISNVKEGLPVSLSLQVSLPAPDEVDVATRATADQESAVENLVLLFYKDDKHLPIEIKVGSQQLSEGYFQSRRQYTCSVDIPVSAGLTSGTWYLYGVANYGKKYVDATYTELASMTKTEMDAFCTDGSHELDFVETGVLLSGKYAAEDAKTGKITLKAGENDLTTKPLLTLKRTISRNVFKFQTAEGVTFTPTSIQVFNHSASSTLMERTDVWDDSKIATPVSGATYKANEGGLKDSQVMQLDMEASKTGTAWDKTDSVVFYMQENLQTTTKTLSSYNDREVRNVTEEDPTNRTFKNAPADASYVVIKGHYTGPTTYTINGETLQYDKVTGDVTYTIHLGDFSEKGGKQYNNFSVRRNVNYTYRVTVKGVNNIVVEALTNEEKQSGAEGNLVASAGANVVTLDAHYDQAILLLGDVANFANISDYNLIVSTPKNDFSSKVIKSSSSETDKKKGGVDWIQFAKPSYNSGTFTFQSYGSVYSNTCNIYTLIEELESVGKNKTSTDHILVVNGQVYVAAYVDEYYYSDLNLEKFVNVDDRQMLLASQLSRSSDGQSVFSQTPVFEIKQHSIKCPFKTDGTLDNPFGVESYEETEAATLCQGARQMGTYDSGYERSYGNFSGSDDFYGWENCSSIRTSSSEQLSSLIGKSWSTYVNDSYNGYILGNLANGTPSKIMNKNYSICQFLSRNRDLDGDGVIDENELRWYTPAMEQCLNLWLGMNSLPSNAMLNLDAKLYLTSTAGSSRTWWIDEGVSFGYWKYSDYNSRNKNNVRVIRNLGKNTDAYKSQSSSLVTYNSSTHVVTLTGLQNDALRTSYMTGNYAPHATQSTYDRLPQAFKVAKKLYTYYEDGTTYNTLTPSAVTTLDSIGEHYYEEDDASDKGYWRVPNEKELGVIFQLAQGNSSFLYSASSLYKVGSRTVYDGTRYYWVNGNGNAYFITADETMTSSSTDMKVLLVRDVTTSSSSSKARKASAVKSKKHK